MKKRWLIGVAVLSVLCMGMISYKWRDQATDMISTIDYPHHEIHEGDGFVCTDVQRVNATTMQWMVTVPNTTKWAHMLFGFQATGEFQVAVTRGADRTGTNALVEINRDENSEKVAGISIFRAVSGGTTDGATPIYSSRSGATGNASKTLSAGGIRGNNEFILKQNTKYIVTVTTYADVYVTAEFDWYEHTNVR